MLMIKLFLAASLLAFPVPAQSVSGVNIALNRAAYASASADEEHAPHLATDGSTSTEWVSPAGDQQWIYVDLGETGFVDRLRLNWGSGFPTYYRVEASEEGPRPKIWKEVYRRSAGKGGVEEIALSAVKARCVRILATQFMNGRGCVLKEFQVFGSPRGRSAIPPQPAPRPDGSLILTGGNWKVQNAAFVKATPERIASGDFDDRDWISATVPGTVLNSYLRYGAIPDLRFGNQQTQISDEFFTNNDFWYRDTFTVPSPYRGRRVWLDLDGINWKADVFFNGARVGRIDGAFIRGRFDVTTLARIGEKNCLAVLVHKVDHPGQSKRRKLGFRYENGGILGLDSPTFVSTIGWNWLPTIPGRAVGLWNEVRLESTADVDIVDPWVTSKVPFPDRAELTVRTELRNHSDIAASGVLVGRIGDIEFRKDLTLQPRQILALSLDKDTIPALTIPHPRLWWPNGYGEPNLHTLTLRFEQNGIVSDQKELRFGIREMSYRVQDNILTLFVNGARTLVRGGNWGMEDALLDCDPAGYDLRVRLHRDANLNLIRNWVGMVGREAFYEACDKYGILVWDDFWLANPVDGPPPADEAMFMANVRDKVRRVRGHACLALYCGRNEGMPPDSLDRGMQRATLELDGTRQYIPDSAHGPVTGLGPYEVMPPEWYFANRGLTFHSELGIVAVPVVESMKAMLPEEALWPINDLWAIHDYQTPRMPLYTERMTQRYGAPAGLEDYCRKAQMLNLESAKAMYECLQSRQGSGVVVWMTQAAWPSLICQFYDSSFEPTAAYFGAKRACEPLHVLWDSHADLVKVANDTTAERKGLDVEAQVFGLDGKLRWEQRATLDLAPTSGVTAFPLQRPADPSEVFFVKLILREGSREVSGNFYWSASQDKSCAALGTLSKAALEASARGELRSGLEVTLENPGPTVALMVRLKLQDEKGQQILPVFYEDNYLSLLPGEKRVLRISVDETTLQGRKARLLLEGWNVAPAEIPLP